MDGSEKNLLVSDGMVSGSDLHHPVCIPIFTPNFSQTLPYIEKNGAFYVLAERASRHPLDERGAAIVRGLRAPVRRAQDHGFSAPASLADSR